MAIKAQKLAALFAVCALNGCKTAHQVRDPEYAQVSQAVHASWQGALPAAEIMNPVIQTLARPDTV